MLSFFSHNTGRTQWEDPRKPPQNSQQDIQSMKSLNSSYSIQENNEGNSIFLTYSCEVFPCRKDCKYLKAFGKGKPDCIVTQHQTVVKSAKVPYINTNGLEIVGIKLLRGQE